MMSYDPDTIIGAIFATLNPETLRLSSRESSTLEFKEGFNWAGKDKYAKAMAAFSNHLGGCLVFGVANSPRRLVGLSGTAFDTIDEAAITGYLNSLFSPAIQYEKFSSSVQGRNVGVIVVK